MYLYESALNTARPVEAIGINRAYRDEAVMTSQQKNEEPGTGAAGAGSTIELRAPGSGVGHHTAARQAFIFFAFARTNAWFKVGSVYCSEACLKKSAALAWSPFAW
jgi:hypothetical protein